MLGLPEQEKDSVFHSLTLENNITIISIDLFHQDSYQNCQKKNCELKLNQSLKEKRIKKIDYIKSNEFTVGTLVKHNDFGEGKVLGINGKKLQVKFKKFEEIMSIFQTLLKNSNVF